MLISVNKSLFLYATRPIHAKLRMSLLTLSTFTQQIKFSFEFLYSFGPTHAGKIETEMILAAFNNICITGFK